MSSSSLFCALKSFCYETEQDAAKLRQIAERKSTLRGDEEAARLFVDELGKEVASLEISASDMHNKAAKE